MQVNLWKLKKLLHSVRYFALCFLFFPPFFSIPGSFWQNCFAAPAQIKTQVPGYFRLAIGDFEVTALYDGNLKLEHTQIFKGVTAPELRKLLEKVFITGTEVITPISAYLVNTGSNLVLVDAGAAKCFGPGGGNLIDSIKAAGYSPDQIETIYITHMHGDHVCGLTSSDGKMNFPNATVSPSQAEADFWLNEKMYQTAPEEFKSFIKMAVDAVKVYRENNKFKPFGPKDTLVKGFTAVPTYGHTPGHTSYQISSGNDSLIVIGDIIHSYSTQFPNPKIGVVFDNDGKKAIAQRVGLFTNAAKNKIWLSGAHLPFPGIGHIRKEGKGFAWVPVEYAPYGVSNFRK
ncbi:MBL fold metallo-hydrolase [Pigmentibacter ruber]|uniref:MBL fold metallo-hydrolase n=1 Tax=Pigmentibacter ruber TaxID=2683196 RepID=UPI00131EB868|nr:MBL fold metallo-hydrolase [Pigmentibacter ruber]BFD33057.1 MBL fold metallo-hydrolase [Pigmentibacter ruber]